MSAARKKPLDQIRQLIADTVEHPDRTDIPRRLESMGFPAPQNLVDSFRTVSSRLAVDPQSYEQLATLSLDLLSSPSPSGAMVNFVRFLETSGASGVFLNTMAGGKPLREILATVFGTSQYMSDIIIRNPGYLYWLVEMQTWHREDTTATYVTELEHDISNFHSVDTKLDAVRRLQRRMLLKIGVKDLLGIHTIEQTTSSLSDLADVITSGVLAIFWNEATSSLPKSPGGFAVLALGKLGGGELNYSSDIDLIYICEDTDDETVAVYHKLAGRLTKALSEVTAEGYLYRVDLRLRPDGSVGPLVSPFDIDDRILREPRQTVGISGDAQGSRYRRRHRPGKALSRSDLRHGVQSNAFIFPGTSDRPNEETNPRKHIHTRPGVQYQADGRRYS